MKTCCIKEKIKRDFELGVSISALSISYPMVIALSLFNMEADYLKLTRDYLDMLENLISEHS